MKALTVQQPWAWAIVHGGKDVENRTQAWSYRGPLAIHAGQRWSTRGAGIVPSLLVGDDVRMAYDGLFLDEPTTGGEVGAIIGVVDLVDVHVAQPEGLGADDVGNAACCESPWAETEYAEYAAGDDRAKVRRDVVHLVLENPRSLAEPIPCAGRLGLWTPPADVLEQVSA